LQSHDCGSWGVGAGARITATVADIEQLELSLETGWRLVGALQR